MRKFYEQAIVRGLVMLLVLAAIVFVGHHLSDFSKPLLPLEQAFEPWRLSALSGSEGEVKPPSSDEGVYLALKESVTALNFAFSLSSLASYPFISVEMHFDDPTPDVSVDHVDFSDFRRLRFTAQCSRHEVLAVVIRMYEPQISKTKGPNADRLGVYFYDCPTKAAVIDAPFAGFEVPEWWLVANEFALTDSQLHLERVVAFAWGASSQTTHDTAIEVAITDVELIGYRWQLLALSLFVAACMALAFVVYLFKAHSIALRAHLGAKQESDKPLVAYQKVVLEPHRDKERSAIIAYIAEHYTQSELTLEQLTQQVGIGRNKVNDTIKDEIGLTFTAYINKLRLTEAARLLKESEDASVSEVAFAVGYNNPSYFNKLFKAEYGCTPKAYRQH